MSFTFNPANCGKNVLPRWRRFSEYLHSIQRAPLGSLEKGLCYWEVLRFGFYPRKWVTMGQELFESGRFAIRARMARAGFADRSIDRRGPPDILC